MLKKFLDTIIAPITGTQRAAVAIVRLSGSDSLRIARELFSKMPENLEPRKMLYGKFSNGDDGLLVYFPEGQSYTGEETIEMHTHGSPASVKSLIQHACELGARPALPGEFTQRAFLNGRIDLTQAEGVRETIDSQTEAQLRAASSLREGSLHEKVSRIRKGVLQLLGAVEATTDFSEEIGDLDRDDSVDKIDGLLKGLQLLLGSAESSKVIKEGIKVALVGLPNAGKSSLLNALLGEDRAIVTDIPGTTRDTVEELVDLGGVPCHLIDTAGLRETEDSVEKIGVERTKKAAENADYVWYLYDSDLGWQPDDEMLCGALQRPATILANKIDLNSNPKKGLPISTQTYEGIKELIDDFKQSAMQVDTDTVSYINARHKLLLEKTVDALNRVSSTLSSDMPTDLAAVDLSEAVQSLGEITGESASADIVDQIFSDFCIGK